MTTERDDILDRIDGVLAGDDQHIGVDWEVSGDAMRSRPATEDDERHDEPTHRQPGVLDISSVIARAARMVHDREQAVARLAAVTDVEYARAMRWTTGGDVRQLELITQVCAAVGFTDVTRERVRNALAVGPEALAMISRAYIPATQGLAAGGLPEPHPNLRLRVIYALGLMPVLARLVTWLSAALERLRPVLDRLDPRPSARRRRRDARRPARTIMVTLTADTTAFNEAMRRVGVAAAEGATNLVAAMNRLFGPNPQAVIRRMHDRAEIRAIARTELAEARTWLDHHVDTIYADLQLDRPRGDHE
jgi:hypothetical protein